MANRRSATLRLPVLGLEVPAIVSHLDPNPPASSGQPDPGAISVLTPEVAAKVRLSPSSRFNVQSLAAHVRSHPGLAYVTDVGRQYVVAGLWRRRPEIAELIEASRGCDRLALIDTLSQSLRERGFKLLVIDYGLDSRDPDFFRRAGFVLVERILEYELPDSRVVSVFRRPEIVLRAYHPSDRDAVLEVEHESFPWLWWNSLAEWDAYLATRDVEVTVATISDRIVGYAGYIVYQRDGHLDRLAVRRELHGRGFGAVLLTHALDRMRQRGARRVGLTTQENNFTSQRLYEKNGFRRGRWTYEIYGRWLGPTEDEA